MTFKNLAEKANGLMPWNWGKQPVRVRDERDEITLARREDMGSVFDEFFESLLPRRFGGGRLASSARPMAMFESSWPRIDLEETDSAFKMTAEVPGMEANDVEVTIGDRSLTIRGSKTTRNEDRRKDYHVMETYSGSFHRTVPLTAGVDADGVEAHCRNGQLTVTVPKVAAGNQAAKRIEVK